MNKALEQKLIGPLKESHTKEQSPKQLCERCFELGDQKSQQNELELVLELVGDFFGRKKECVGAGISGAEPPWAHEAGGAPWTLVARCLLPLLCCRAEIYPSRRHFDGTSFGGCSTNLQASTFSKIFIAPCTRLIGLKSATSKAPSFLGRRVTRDLLIAVIPRTSPL